MSTKHWQLVAALILVCSTVTAAGAGGSQLPQDALKHLLKVIKNPPFYALDWHDLKLVAADEQLAIQLKDALNQSGRSTASIMEQSLWVDAAAGHPEAALTFYDGNVLKHPEDKSLPNTACWARAVHGLDLGNAMAVCNAAVAADRAGYTLVFRGMTELQLGLFDGALRDFNEALGNKKFQAHPMLADAEFGRGIARIRLGDTKGLEDIKVAMQANTHVAAHFADIGVTQ